MLVLMTKEERVVSGVGTQNPFETICLKAENKKVGFHEKMTLLVAKSIKK